MPTLADIAKETGLSVPAVSQILNNHAGYREETRHRVMATAERLGYRPHYFAKALASGKTNTLGLITSPFTTTIHALTIDRLTAYAAKLGYMPYVATYSDVDVAVSLASEMANYRVEGVVLHQVVPNLERVQQVLDKKKTPYIFIDCVPENASGVAMNRASAFAQAAKHLGELGHKQACFLSTHFELTYPDRRIAPYRKFCEQQGIAMSVGTIGRPEYGQEAYEYVRQAITQPDPPTAWLCGDDEIALAALSAIHASGFRVPEHFSVVGFNDLPFSKVAWPPLTTIHQPREELPKAAMDMLHRIIATKPTCIEHESVDCYLVIRDSTGPAPKRR